MQTSIPDFSKMTVLQLKEFASTNTFKIPSGLKKMDMVTWLQGACKERIAGLVTTKVKSFPLQSIQARYVESKDDWLAHLYQHGWSVVPIPGWKPEFVNMFLAFLETCSPNFKATDPSTWKVDNLPILSRGVLKHYFGHTEMQWQIRELCAPLFARMWGCPPEDLLSSFDGGAFMLPEPGATTKAKIWIHNDTPRNEQGIYNFCCVQGIVNFVDNGPSDGGLILVEGSQNVLKEYLDKHPSEGISWGMADMGDCLLRTKPLIKICAPAGHMILFDSRIFHCNISPTGNIIRMCTYVSMQLRSEAKEEELAKRQRLYTEGRMTGHWCCGPWFKETGKDPNTYGKPHNKPSVIEIAPVNELRSRLIGY